LEGFFGASEVMEEKSVKLHREAKAAKLFQISQDLYRWMKWLSHLR